MRLHGPCLTRPIIRLLIGLGCLCLLIPSPAIAQTFDQTSLNGTYSGRLIGEGGRFPIIAVLVASFDGAGNVLGGRAYLNIPDPAVIGQRMVQELPVPPGTYQVGPEGKGTMEIPQFFISTWNFVVMRATVQESASGLVQQLYWVGDTLEPLEANLMTGNLNRLPDGSNFTSTSVRGSYVRRFITFGNQLPITALGKFDWDNSIAMGDTTINGPGPTAFERFIDVIPGSASLTTFPDGLLILDPIDNASVGQGFFAIIEAEQRIDGTFLATDIEGFLTLPATSSVLSVNVTRRGD